MNKIAFFMMASLLCGCLANAQERYPHERYPQTHPMHEKGMDMPKRMTPEEIAAKKTDEMKKAVGMDDKQYKKIYKIYLKEENARSGAMVPPGGQGNGFPGGGRPPQGGGMPPHGGNFQGEMPPQGGGFPGGGMPPQGGFPNAPAQPTVGGKAIDSEEYIEGREAKIRKILGEDKYIKWRKSSPDPYGIF